MFAKVFEQIFDSSIAENYQVRHMFMDLLVMANSDGVVDKTPEAISRIANVPLEIVRDALHVLASPDKFSRTPDLDGRRIELVDSHRDWGWRIINYEKYRKIRDEESRRVANRIYQRNSRARRKVSNLSRDIPDSQQCQPKQREREKQRQKQNSTEREIPNSSGAPPSKYTQTDFDERDIRKLSAAKNELAQRLSAAIGSNDQITHEQFFEQACELAGITVQRGMKLEEMQRKWPTSTTK